MRFKLLNGAPLSEHLTFNEETLRVATECSSFSTIIWDDQSNEEQAVLKWRDIGVEKASLRTGWSQPHLPGTGPWAVHESHSFEIPGVEEFSTLPGDDTTNLDTTLMLGEEVSAVDEYLQHSLVFHDTLLSSQVVPVLAADDTVTSSSFLTTSFGSTSSERSSPCPIGNNVPSLQVPSSIAVTTLGSLPSAQHLRSIYPQTPTPNFVCALMTTPERREVFVRKGGYKMDLWEVVVGDDTNSNFKVTFWMRPRDSNNEKNHAQVQLLDTLKHLQVGNIVLLRNIALTSFRDTVYGQSLNTSISRARTSVDVLTKRGGISTAQASRLPVPVLETFIKIKRWARVHVVGMADNLGKGEGGPARPCGTAKRSFTSFTQDDQLPPDTMEAV